MTALNSELRSKSQPRRLLRRGEAAIYAGVSPSAFDGLVKTGVMPVAKLVGGVRAWDVRQLDLAIDALPDDGSGVTGTSWD